LGLLLFREEHTAVRDDAPVRRDALQGDQPAAAFLRRDLRRADAVRQDEFLSELCAWDASDDVVRERTVRAGRLGLRLNRELVDADAGISAGRERVFLR
jgi:hypothetical protein